MRSTPCLKAASLVVSAGNSLSLIQHDCRGQGTDGTTRSPCPQDSIRVGDCPQAGSGRMDWAAPGNCWAQRQPDLRCEAGLRVSLQERATLALPTRCQQGLLEWWGERTRAVCRAISKKGACLALECSILFLYGGFLSVLPKYPAPAPWGGLCRGLQRRQGIFIEGFAYTQASRITQGLRGSAGAAGPGVCSRSSWVSHSGWLPFFPQSVGCPEGTL